MRRPGTEPFRYQWQRNGEDLPDSRNRSLSFAAAQPANDAAYNVVVSNPHGAATSRVATLSVLPLVDALAGQDVHQCSAWTVALPSIYATITRSETNFVLD